VLRIAAKQSTHCFCSSR